MLRDTLWKAIFTFFALLLLSCEGAKKKSIPSEELTEMGTSPAVLPSAALDPKLRVEAFSFASCADQRRPQPLWNQILLKSPGLHLALGDNVYPGGSDTESMTKAYQQLLRVPEFMNFRSLVPILPTWDDHDYGQNDGGADHPQKWQAREAFLAFWEQIPPEVRSRNGDLSYALLLGPPGQRLHFIFLDTRWDRGPLSPIPTKRGFYSPSQSPDQRMLGESQWKWLEQELRKKSELQILISSIQVLPEEHPFEKWANLPRERARLLDLVSKNSQTPLLILSGDRHAGEVSRIRDAKGRDLWEVTASSINRPGSIMEEKSSLRVGKRVAGTNFGLLNLDWKKRKARVGLYSEDGKPEVEFEIPLKTR